MRIFFITFLSIGFLLTACSKADIEINAAYTPVRSENQNMYAAYFEITNNTDKAIELDEINSVSFSSVMLHQSSVENGMAKMRHLDKLTIGKGETVKLQPNGKHVMLMGAKENIWNKDEIILTLSFNDGRNIEQTVQLNKPDKN